MRTILAILYLVGSIILSVAQQHAALPVRFQSEADDGSTDAASSSQPTIIVGREPNAYIYTYPYSKYAPLSPTLTRIKRELQLGGEQQQQQQGQDGAAVAAEDEMLEHVVSLGDLMAELGNGHVENINDAQLKAATALQDDFERGVAAYEATVELYQHAMTFFGGEEGEEHGSHGLDNDVVSLLTGMSTIQLLLAELVISDPSLNELMVGPDGNAANAAAVPVPISPEILSPFYAKALRHNRDAVQSCERALELLAGNKEGTSAVGGFDEEWSAQLELACADASVRLGSHIVECYESGLIDLVLEKDNGSEGKLQSTVVAMDGHNVENEVLDSDDPLQMFGINGERVLKLARESFEKAAAVYRRSEATAANAQASDHDDRVQLADASAAIGLVSLYLGDLTNSISMYEDSIEIYSQLESEGYQHDLHDHDGGIPFILADMLVQLSDVLLRAGRYDECDSRYQQAMDKHAELAATSNGSSANAPQPQLNRLSQFEGDDSLRLHEDALNDYYASLGANGAANVLDDWGQDELDDPLYEGDLLFNIGTIHLSQNNLDEALTYLTKAITLYESSLEENEEGPLADALLNKASCLLYLGRYAESAATHEEATEIYRASLGEGNGEADTVNSFGSNGSRSSRIRDRLINLDDVVLGIRNTTQVVL